MYVLLLLGLVATGVALTVAGRMRTGTGATAAGLGLVAATSAFFALLGISGQQLWFEEVGLTRRVWTQVLAQGGVMHGGAAAAVACSAGAQPLSS